jgi:striatin 1/3/4
MKAVYCFTNELIFLISDLQAKIAFLQGERKGHDNLVRDLVRRIKMLEFALKQER